MENNRQTGKTARIINHVVNELFSVGKCVSADHTFELEKLKKSQIDYFIERVERRMTFESNGLAKVNSRILDIDGKKMVEFTLVK